MDMSFDTEAFTAKLIAETLFYDEEYGALGNLSLIDESELKECFIAAYSPEDDRFIIEEATEWETETPPENDDIGYSLAVDSTEFGTYPTAEDAAREIVRLARKNGLTPSITLLFEQDDLV